HIRKPQYNSDDLRFYTERVAKQSILHNISLHHNLQIVDEFNLGGYHMSYSDMRAHETHKEIIISCSTHSIIEAEEAEKSNIEYYFLSPIFDSISKNGYKSNFTSKDISLFLALKRRCVALGGVDYNKLHLLSGFDSIALLGAVWVIEDGKINVSQSIKQFEKIDELWRELKDCNI
ncbi:MAG: thiamine phosphate synthase, partial [Rikenellaceae bacterium]